MCRNCEEARAEHCDPCAVLYERVKRDEGYHDGAAVAFGLMGMAESIRDREWMCMMCESTSTGHKCQWCAVPRGLGSDDRSKDHG